jgi:hypothetical protein
VGGFAGGGIGRGGAAVAGYKTGGEQGRDEGNRKFCAIFRRPAPAFSSTRTENYTIFLLEPAAAKVDGISDTINRAMIIRFLFIIPSL